MTRSNPGAPPGCGPFLSPVLSRASWAWSLASPAVGKSVRIVCKERASSGRESERASLCDGVGLRKFDGIKGISDERFVGNKNSLVGNCNKNIFVRNKNSFVRNNNIFVGDKNIFLRNKNILHQPRVLRSSFQDKFAAVRGFQLLFPNDLLSMQHQQGSGKGVVSLRVEGKSH